MSAIIKSPADTPIIVERAMYLTTGDLFYGAGHASAGIRSAVEPNGSSQKAPRGEFFDLFILIAQPQ